ncbi:MAG: BatD family protein [Saprospiraceae bacterium]|nr:BatD family protein [Saprospiraceae bacterium]
MKPKLILFLMGFLFVGILTAQENAKFSVSISTDSILLGNYFVVNFTLENVEGKEFNPPIFKEFIVISGPNTSSSFSMINGEVKQSVSYTYYLEPKDIGSYFIEPASIRIEDKVLETDIVEINVFPNPDGIKQDPQNPFQQRFEFKMDDLFSFPELEPHNTPKPQPKKKKKKKRKTYKI